MGQLTVNRQGPEVFQDNYSGYEKDYTSHTAPKEPTRKPTKDWRSLLVVYSMSIVGFLVLCLIYAIWKALYCIDNYTTCLTLNAVEPFVFLVVFILPVLVFFGNSIVHILITLRQEYVLTNRAHILYDAYGDPIPANIFDRLSPEMAFALLEKRRTGRERLEEVVAPHKIYRSVNSLSLSQAASVPLLPAPADSDNVVVDVLPHTESNLLPIQFLLQRGFIDRSGNSLLVGFDRSKNPHYIELDETGLIALAGQPRSGKSTTALFLIAQILLIEDSVLIVADKHGRKDRGLLHLLNQIQHLLTHIAIDTPDILASIDMWYEIGANRLADQQKKDYAPCFIVIDEFTALVLLDMLPPAALHKLMSGAVEFPKVQVYGIIIGHQWNGKLIGSFGAPMRRASTQRIVHRIDPQDAGFLLTSGASRGTMSLTQGSAIFHGASSPNAVEVRVPYIDVRDLEYLARQKKVTQVTQVSTPTVSASIPVTQPVSTTAEKIELAKELLSKKATNGDWMYTYRQVRRITRLSMQSIVNTAALVGRSNK